MGLPSCVSYDPHALKMALTHQQNGDTSGHYMANAAYNSSVIGFIGSDHLGRLAHASHHGKDADEVHITQTAGPRLIFDWRKNGISTAQSTLDPEDGLHFDKNGVLTRHASRGFLPRGMGDPSWFGFNFTTYQYAKDQKGNFVVFQNGHAGGMILVIPLYITTRHVSVFQPKALPHSVLMP